MANETNVTLELDDIQSGVLRPRPSPYAAAYILLRIDDHKSGRELMRRAATVVTSAAKPTSGMGDASVSVALTFQGLKALRVPQPSQTGMLFPPSDGEPGAKGCHGDGNRARP